MIAIKWLKYICVIANTTRMQLNCGRWIQRLLFFNVEPTICHFFHTKIIFIILHRWNICNIVAGGITKCHCRVQKTGDLICQFCLLLAGGGWLKHISDSTFKTHLIKYLLHFQYIINLIELQVFKLGGQFKNDGSSTINFFSFFFLEPPQDAECVQTWLKSLNAV